MTSLGDDGLLKGASPAAQTNAAKMKWEEEWGLTEVSRSQRLCPCFLLEYSQNLGQRFNGLLATGAGGGGCFLSFWLPAVRMAWVEGLLWQAFPGDALGLLLVSRGKKTVPVPMLHGSLEWQAPSVPVVCTAIEILQSRAVVFNLP